MLHIFLCDKPEEVVIMQEIQKNIAKNLRRCMRERNLSTIEFAEELGIPLTSAKNYLKGKSNPTAETISLLADKLNITPVELISGLPPGWEQAEIVLRASKEIAALPLARQEIAVRLLLELAALFAE